MPLVYDELRRVAARYIGRERPGQTLQATALVNEAFVRLVGEKARGFENRAHFVAIAALSMRQILVQRARARNAAKRGGAPHRITLADHNIDQAHQPVPRDHGIHFREEALAPRHLALGAPRQTCERPLLGHDLTRRGVERGGHPNLSIPIPGHHPFRGPDATCAEIP